MYENRLSEIKESNTYDIIEMSGSKAEWKEVLTVYSVKVNTDTDNPQEVVTMDEGKRQLFKDIFLGDEQHIFADGKQRGNGCD